MENNQFKMMMFQDLQKSAVSKLPNIFHSPQSEFSYFQRINQIFLSFFLTLLVSLFIFIFAGKLFVGGLSWQTTLEKLREYFGQFGSVTDVLVMKDPVTQVRISLFFQSQLIKYG